MRSTSAIVREAGALALAERAKGLAIEAKERQDFVTQADRAVERLLRMKLTALLPGSDFLGEEEGGEVDSDLLWVVDPIDGTTNFIRGLPHWCVSVALLKAGEPTIGVIFAPVLDWLYQAERGKGATRNGELLQRGPVKPSEAIVNVGQSFRQSVELFTGIIRGLRERRLDHRLLGSGALGLALTASGEVDASVEGDIQPWDVAAGLLISREAGCVVNNFFIGNAMTKGNPTVSAASGVEDVVFQVMEKAVGTSLPRQPPT